MISSDVRMSNLLNKLQEQLQKMMDFFFMHMEVYRAHN